MKATPVHQPVRIRWTVSTSDGSLNSEITFTLTESGKMNTDLFVNWLKMIELGLGTVLQSANAGESQPVETPEGSANT